MAMFTRSGLVQALILLIAAVNACRTILLRFRCGNRNRCYG